MRISKPCKFEGQAKAWPGYEEIKYGTTGKPYEVLEKLIGGNSIMDVYIDMDPDAFIDSTPQNSFKQDIHAKMRYSEFLEKSGQSSNSLGMVLRDESESTTKSLLSKVKGPSFMEDIADLDGIVFMQSTGGIHSPPRYDHFEQIICSVDGLVQIKLVPHVYR